MSTNQDRFDVVVVGCGIAGLSAAVSAAQEGARVAVLERAPIEERGGNTRYTEARLRMKSESEVSDDFEMLFMNNPAGHIDPSLIDIASKPRANWPAILKSLSFADPDVIAAFSANVGPTVQWMKSCGARFDVNSINPAVTVAKAARRIGTHGGGLGLIEALAPVAEKAGVAFFYETTALELVQGDDGSVSGVKAVSKGGKPRVFSGSVVLGSGGFEGNPEMMTQYLGPLAAYLRPAARGGYYNKGEGIRMGLRIGAAPCGDYGSWHAEPIDPRSGISEPVIYAYPYGIIVNRQGHRFVDEAVGPTDATYCETTRNIPRQPGGIAYIILDDKFNDVPGGRRGIRTDQPAIQAGAIAELAVKLGIPAGTLANTISRYNAACRPGTFKPLEMDGLATEGVEPPKSNWAITIERPPFMAYPIVSSVTFTHGGLKVNTDAQVLNVEGDAIEGLYAAGEVVGLYFQVYVGATSVLKGAVFGRLAGLHAARNLRHES